MGSSQLPDLRQLSVILGDTGRSVDSDWRPVDVCIDSRDCRPGSLFFALPGETTDGHAFVQAAASAGAGAAVVRQASDLQGNAWPVPVLVVSDALRALQRLAAWYVTTHLVGTTVRIGITGSNGKTSTKEMMAAALRRTVGYDAVFASAGNLNSETGLPLSVLATPPGSAYAIYEMAMSNPGEIAPLAEIVRPDFAVITNIGTAHIGQLGSRDAIAAEKKNIASAFDGSQTLVFPAADDYADYLSTGINGVVLPVSAASLDVDIAEREGHARVTLGDTTVELPMLGAHHGANALLVLAVVRAMDLDAETAAAALGEMDAPQGRGRFLSLPGGIRVLDDTYNANPESMHAALQAAETAGARVFVLGDMLELGSLEASGHLAVLRDALQRSPRLVICVGPRFAGAVKTVKGDAVVPSSLELLCVPTSDEAGELLCRSARSGDVILLKGSRGIALERAIAALHTREAVDA